MGKVITIVLLVVVVLVSLLTTTVLSQDYAAISATTFGDQPKDCKQLQQCLDCQLTVGYGFSSLNFYPSGYVSLPTTNLEESFTIEAWVLPLGRIASGEYQTIFSHSPFSPEFGPQDADFALRILPNGHLNFYMGSGDTAQTSTGLSIDCGNVLTELSWSHVSVSVEGSPVISAPYTIYIFINGSQVGSYAGPFNGARQYNMNRNNPIIFGEWVHGNNTEYFNGRVDEIRLWNVSRTPAQVAATYQYRLDTSIATFIGLQGLYHLDENAGIFVTDSVTGSSQGIIGDTPYYYDINFEVWSGSQIPFLYQVVSTPNTFTPITLRVRPATTGEYDYSGAPVIAFLNGDLNFGTIYNSPQLRAGNRYSLGDPIFFRQNETSVTLYYYTTVLGAYETLFYTAITEDIDYETVTAKYPNGVSGYQSIITIVNNNSSSGCDGFGNFNDNCNVCGGTDFNGCVFGCEKNSGGVNVTYDSCGVCNGNSSCQNCLFNGTINGYGSRQLDRIILYAESAVMAYKLSELYENELLFASNLRNNNKSGSLFSTGNQNVVGQGLNSLSQFKNQTAFFSQVVNAFYNLIEGNPSSYQSLSSYM